LGDAGITIYKAEGSGFIKSPTDYSSKFSDDYQASAGSGILWAFRLLLVLLAGSFSFL
jgi:hypothetical protein